MVKAWFLGLRDALKQGELSHGLTFDNDPYSPQSVAYDRGANLGEWIRGRR